MLDGVGDDVGVLESDGLGGLDEAGLDDGGVLEPDELGGFDGVGLDEVGPIEPGALGALDEAGLEPVGALAASGGLPRLDPLELGPGPPAPIVNGQGAGAQTWHGRDPSSSLGADGRVTDLSG